MNEASIRDGLRRHYENETLPEATRARLRSLWRRGGQQPRGGFGRRRLIAAAGVLLAISAGAVIYTSATRATLREAVAKEIALNHAKHPEVTHSASAYEALRGHLDRLDFTLVGSSHAAMEGLALTGARYCSLQGHIAAQLRLEDARGRRVTLYQVRAAETFDGLTDAEIQIEGLRIQFWREAGVLLGLARPLD